MAIPTVDIIIADNGSNAAVQLPQSNVQVVIGTCIGGTANIPVATTNPATLVSNFTAGPLVEAAGLVCQAGGTVIAIKAATSAPGTATSVVPTVTGGSTTTITLTLNGTHGAYDDYYAQILCATGGTIGSTGIQFQVSLDAGRTYGAIISLGTATTYAIPNTGITLNFAAGTLVAGDYWRFSTTAPAWNTAGVQAALVALGASQYAIAGWGSTHIVGVSSAAAAASFQTYLDSLAAQFLFTRAIITARDALAPVAWGGSGETETTWINSLATAFSATSAKRICVGGGYYNTPTPYPNSAAGSPSYRRPLSWSDAVRRVLVPPQRRGGRVKDGALTNITVDPATDPGDGFVYHDERINPGLDAARFMAAMTWPKKTGFYIVHENLMSPVGSQFTELVLGNVIDIACDIGYATGVSEISDDLRLTSTGTLFATDALILQGTIDGALAAGMTNVAMVSAAYSSVSQTANVGATNVIPIDISILPRGYVDSIVETINLATL